MNKRKEKEVSRPSELNWMLTSTESHRKEPADVPRSGVHERTEKELRRRSYIISRSHFATADGVRFAFAHTVSHHRGYDEAKAVRDQAGNKPQWSKYGRDLLQSVFKNW